MLMQSLEVADTSYYVYALYDSSKCWPPFYIGKSKNPHRLKQHIRDAKNGIHCNEYLQRKILKVLSVGNEVTMHKIIANVSNKVAGDLETETIAFLRSIKEKICNINDGGDGSPGLIRTAESKKALKDKTPSRKVKRLSDGKLYNSLADCAKDNTTTTSGVILHCKNKLKTQKYVYVTEIVK